MTGIENRHGNRNEEKGEQTRNSLEIGEKQGKAGDDGKLTD